MTFSSQTRTSNISHTHTIRHRWIETFSTECLAVCACYLHFQLSKFVFFFSTMPFMFCRMLRWSIGFHCATYERSATTTHFRLELLWWISFSRFHSLEKSPPIRLFLKSWKRSARRCLSIFFFFSFIPFQFHSSVLLLCDEFSCWSNINGMWRKSESSDGTYAATVEERKGYEHIALTLFRSHLFPFNKYVLFLSSSAILPMPHLNALKIIIYCVEHTHYYYYYYCRCCPCGTIRMCKERN